LIKIKKINKKEIIRESPFNIILFLRAVWVNIKFNGDIIIFICEGKEIQ
jgi:hypothetical protein